MGKGRVVERGFLSGKGWRSLRGLEGAVMILGSFVIFKLLGYTTSVVRTSTVGFSNTILYITTVTAALITERFFYRHISIYTKGICQ